MSALPVDTAMFGMLSFTSPVAIEDGIAILPCGLSTHCVVLTCTTLRHLPIWTTSGIFWPTGAFVSENVPSTPVTVLTTAPLL